MASLDGARPRLPLLIVPGFMSSGLEVKQSDIYEHWQDQRIWLSLQKLGINSAHKKGLWAKENKENSKARRAKIVDESAKLAKQNLSNLKNITLRRTDESESQEDGQRTLKNLWLQHLLLKSAPGEDPNGIKVRPVPGLAGIRCLDPDSFFGLVADPTYVFAPVIDVLESMGYEEAHTVDTANYDWRLAPSGLQNRDAFFDDIKVKVENLNRHGTGVVLLGHSMGNKTIMYFLRYAQVHYGQKWLDTHVFSYLSIGAPHLGAPAAARATIFGDGMGLDSFLTMSEARVMAQSFASSPWMFPVGSSAENLFHVRRQGVLEISGFCANVKSCKFDCKKHAVKLTIDIEWDDKRRDSLTTKSSVSFDPFAEAVATFANEDNHMQFGGPPELPENAVIKVTAKEWGLIDGRSLQRPVKLLVKHAVQSTSLLKDACTHDHPTKGHPKAYTDIVRLKDCLQNVQSEDGFVDVRLPLVERVTSLGKRKPIESDVDCVTFQMRWRDFRAVRSDWLGAQGYSPSTCQSEVSIQHEDESRQEVYDAFSLREMLKMDDACRSTLQTWDEHYVSDPHYSHTGVDDVPPVKRVVAMHGTKVPTEVAFAVRVNTVRFKRRVSETRFVLDTEAQLLPSPQTRRCLTMRHGIIYEEAEGACDSGDGTVPFNSVEHYKTWAEAGVEVQVEQFEGVEHRPMLADPRFHLALLRELSDMTGTSGIRLKIRLASAANLTKADTFSDSDPYCICAIKGREWCTKYQTKVVMNDLNPVWNEEHVIDGYEEGEVLKFTVLDWDAWPKSHDWLGEACLMPEQFYPHGWSGDLMLEVGTLRVEVDVFTPHPTERRAVRHVQSTGDKPHGLNQALAIDAKEQGLPTRVWRKLPKMRWSWDTSSLRRLPLCSGLNLWSGTTNIAKGIVDLQSLHAQDRQRPIKLQIGSDSIKTFQSVEDAIEELQQYSSSTISHFSSD